MPRIVRTARGEEVDFDAIIIKQALAQAPMNVEVARRKDYIDAKEQPGRKPSTFTESGQIDQAAFVEQPAHSSASEFDSVEMPTKKTKRAEPIPNLPEKS